MTADPAAAALEAIAMALLEDQRGSGLPVLRAYVDKLLDGDAPEWPHEITTQVNDMDNYRQAMDWPADQWDAELREQYHQDRETARIAYAVYRYRTQAPVEPYDEDQDIYARLARIVIAYQRDLVRRTFDRAQREERTNDL